MDEGFSRTSAGKLTAQPGRSENCGTKTDETVAASRGLEVVALATRDCEFVVGGTSATPTAEHCALEMLRIPPQVR